MHLAAEDRELIALTRAVDGVETNCVVPGGAEHVRVYPDGAAALADFIHRKAAWLAGAR